MMNDQQQDPNRGDGRQGNEDRGAQYGPRSGYRPPQPPPPPDEYVINYSIGLPLFLIITGALWLLHVADLLPSARESVGYGLVVLGLFLFVILGFNKRTVIVAPLIMYVGIAVLTWSYFHRADVLIAVGMIIGGALMLISFADWIPEITEENDFSNRFRGGRRM